MMRLILASCLWACALAALKTVDVGPILDLDLTLYQLTYDKNKGESMSDFPEQGGFSANQVELHGMDTAERIGQAYIAVDGPLYRMAYGLHIPDLHFVFGKLDVPGMGSYSDVNVSSSENRMNRFLEYTPLVNGRCLISDGVVWTDLGKAYLHIPDQEPKDVSNFFNTTFRQAINTRSGYVNRETEAEGCKKFTTPFTTVFV